MARQRRVVLVTGASRGIGRAVAEILAPQWRVLVGGTSPTSVAQVVSTLPDADGFVADLTDVPAVAQAVAGLQRLDAVVHSAGIAENGTIEHTARQTWRQLFELNVVAVADLTRMLLPLLRVAHGQVVTINSGAGYSAGADYGAYAASKFALRAFTDALREEERGVLRVSSIHPGRVDTDMQMALQTSRGRAYDPGDHLRPASVAAAVKLALDASDEAMIEAVTVRPVSTR